MTRRGAVRWFCAVRSAEAAALLISPSLASLRSPDRGSDPVLRPVVRSLALRELVQSLVTAIAPRRGVLAAGAGIDLVHGTSMLALGRAARGVRRPAFASAGLAALCAAIALVLARGEGQRSR